MKGFMLGHLLGVIFSFVLIVGSLFLPHPALNDGFEIMGGTKVSDPAPPPSNCRTTAGDVSDEPCIPPIGSPNDLYV